MNTSLALFLCTLVAFTAAAPKPHCKSCGSGYGSGYSSFGSGYSSYAPATYYESAPVVHEHVAAPVVHEHYSAPVVHEHYSAPVVHEHVSAPVVHEHISAPVVHHEPHVINTWTTKTVGVPEYIPVKTTIQKTNHVKYHVKVPYEYNYEIERPVTHTTSYINYKPQIRNHVVSVPSTTVVHTPTVYSGVSSSVYAPSASYYAPSTSYVSSGPSTSYVSGPSTNYVSAPAAVSSVNYGSPVSSYYSKDYTNSKSYEHLHENYGTNSW